MAQMIMVVVCHSDSHLSQTSGILCIIEFQSNPLSAEIDTFNSSVIELNACSIEPAGAVASASLLCQLSCQPEAVNRPALGHDAL